VRRGRVETAEEIRRRYETKFQTSGTARGKVEKCSGRK